MLLSEEVQSIVDDITAKLDAKIDSSNDDLRFRHPTRSEVPGYVPVRRHGTWPMRSSNDVSWFIHFEIGKGASSSVIPLYYIPDPQQYLSQRATAESIRKEWCLANPDIDMAQNIFVVTGIEGKVVSNSYQEPLKNVMAEIDAIAESRTR